MDMNTMTIAKAHTALKAKEISATELVQSCIDRIENVDGVLNAVIHKSFDSALEQAKNIDQGGEFNSPLTGIPYLTKDNYNEKGVPTTACSNVLRDKVYIPPFSSTTNERLSAAGAISIGKSNTDEFTMGGSTETSCYGVTKNPWDTTRVAGGSSGGSAAGVAADECLFALGTDTGGSIRQPAAFCNCTGLRPTYGRTSRYGVMSMASSLDTIGPLCKSVEDLAIVMETISGHDPMDGTTSKNDVPQYSKALTGDIKGMKIGLPKEYFIDGMDAEVEQSVRDAVKVLEEQGAIVKEISLPHTKYATPCYYVLCPCEVSSNMARYDGIRFGHTVNGAKDLVDYYHQVRTDGFGDEVKRRIMIGTYALSAGYFDAYYRQAQKVRTLIKKDFDDAFANVDIIISPVTPGPAFTIGAYEGDPVAMYLEDIFLDSQVMAGIPALSVPCGCTKDNLPLGLQMMGPQWGEEAILRAGDAYEKATEWSGRKASL
ncbi:MAG: Asp-tRNA(Asn)/Glu-tRNA(Gln) amidotransferase subunit GatA [bacterium]|nr:Asp-tRNA(Asn)/Glu-tRNA(Gln) amidotransferase subunit GatA [bacterium]